MLNMLAAVLGSGKWECERMVKKWAGSETQSWNAGSLGLSLQRVKRASYMLPMRQSGGAIEGLRYFSTSRGFDFQCLEHKLLLGGVRSCSICWFSNYDSLIPKSTVCLVCGLHKIAQNNVPKISKISSTILYYEALHRLLQAGTYTRYI